MSDQPPVRHYEVQVTIHVTVRGDEDTAYQQVDQFLDKHLTPHVLQAGNIGVTEWEMFEDAVTDVTDDRHATYASRGAAPCLECGAPVELYDKHDPDSWIHADGQPDDGHTAEPGPGDWRDTKTRAAAGDCTECGQKTTAPHDLGPQYLVCTGCCEIRYSNPEREVAYALSRR